MGLTATIASTALAASSQYSAGKKMQASKDAQALQLEANARQERAASGRSASEQLRQARLLMSRQQALAMGGGSDVSVINAAADIAGEGELRALTALYEGDERAKSLEYGAVVARQEGRDAKRAGTIGAFTSILSGSATMYDKFGMRNKQAPEVGDRDKWGRE